MTSTVIWPCSNQYLCVMLLSEWQLEVRKVKLWIHFAQRFWCCSVFLVLLVLNNGNGYENTGTIK